MDQGRRSFIKNAVAVAATAPFVGMARPVAERGRFPIIFFTKPLDGYALDFMLETLAEVGVDGLDLTVRPGGRVEPSSIKESLPMVIGSAKQRGLDVEMIVTAIAPHHGPDAEEVLRVAAANGIKHYRMGYARYRDTKDIGHFLQGLRSDFESLARLNRRVGIQGGYQNHAGTYFGAPVWDLWNVLRDISPSEISSQFDIRHAVAEGAFSWIVALRLVGEHIGSLAIKDFTWSVSGGKASAVNVPLGTGIVDFDLFFSTIRELGISVPISLHVEYPVLTDEEKALPLLRQQRLLVDRLSREVGFIRRCISKHKLS